MNAVMDNYIIEWNIQSDENESSTIMHNNMDEFQKHKVEGEKQVKKQGAG